MSDMNERGEDWHREIDNVIRKLVSVIKGSESEHQAFLREQEAGIIHIISEITQIIGELKKLLDSNDGFLRTDPEMQN